MSKPTRDELNAEVIRQRQALAETVDQFSERISPSYQANRIKADAKTTLDDTKHLLTGGGMPTADPTRERNVKVALGSAGALVALVALKVIKAKIRRR